MQINQIIRRKEFRTYAETYNVIPVGVEILADTETPVSLLKKFLSRKENLFLLESVEGGERWGRYSFLGIAARSHIKIYPQAVEITDKHERTLMDHHGDPLGVLQKYMDHFKPPVIPSLPRFWGGIVGYLTYEMVSFFESIPNTYPAEKPLAHFVMPDEIIIFDNIRHTLFCIVLAFSDDNGSADDLYEAVQKRICEIIDEIGHADADPQTMVLTPFTGLNVPASVPDFQSLVTKVKNYIHDGEVIQAVISQPFICEDPPDPWFLYRAQRYINPSPYLFFMAFDELTLVGSSPETMVRLENGVATLRPIAGTRPRGKNDKEDRLLADELLKDEKETAEHLMLVDLGRNDLGRVAETGTVQVTDLMVVERYSHVMHIVSNITCDLKENYTAYDLLKASFPAGTLTGAPKVRAMEIIAEMESEPRGVYGGAVGYISFNGNMDMAITIRTACIENNSLTVRAGAGIVADSVPEKEHQESVNKAMAIQKALQLLQT
jgi:anthranilate synthase component 1